ncbi:oxidation resistance protein 1, partial [Ascosphaera acerosa]
MIFCETGFLSVGGGDGHYGLWVDDGCERGISSPSLTFGNEVLSDEGSKFDILGLE